MRPTVSVVLVMMNGSFDNKADGVRALLELSTSKRSIGSSGGSGISSTSYKYGIELLLWADRLLRAKTDEDREPGRATREPFRNLTASENSAQDQIEADADARCDPQEKSRPSTMVSRPETLNNTRDRSILTTAAKTFFDRGGQSKITTSGKHIGVSEEDKENSMPNTKKLFRHDVVHHSSISSTSSKEGGSSLRLLGALRSTRKTDHPSTGKRARAESEEQGRDATPTDIPRHKHKKRRINQL